MSVSNSLVTPNHNETTCVDMVIFLQNGCICIFEIIVDVKQLWDKKKQQLLLSEAYKHHVIPVLSHSVENSL